MTEKEFSISKRIYELYDEYWHETTMESAWCGHAYATEYFADLRKRLIELATEISNTAWEDKSIGLFAKAALVDVHTDYEEIRRITWEKLGDIQYRPIVIDAICDAFYDTIDTAFTHLYEAYDLISRRNWDEDMYNGYTWPEEYTEENDA